MSIISADGIAYPMPTTEDMEQLFRDPAWRERLIERMHDANLTLIGNELAGFEEWCQERARDEADQARMQDRIDRETADELLASWDATAPVIE